MPINYARRFEREIDQQFARELTSADLARNKKYKFIDAQTIKVPTVIMSGYKDHSRDGTKNRGTISNIYQPFSLTHDRDIEFYVDEMDVDETNQVLSAANITATFNSEQAIPELDALRYSRIYQQFRDHGGVVDTTVLSKRNILLVFDNMMAQMDDAGVPASGRMLKVTPSTYTMLKQAEQLSRVIDVTGGANVINRNVRGLDEVEIVMVPSDRMKSNYDFDNSGAGGWAPASGAVQINFMLYHTDAILAPVKVADVYLWPKGATPESAYGYLYQNRLYTDLFVLKQKLPGIAINAVTDAADSRLPKLYFATDTVNSELQKIILDIYEGSVGTDTYIYSYGDTALDAIHWPVALATDLTEKINGAAESDKVWTDYDTSDGIVLEADAAIGDYIYLIRVDTDKKAKAGSVIRLQSGDIEGIDEAD